MKMLVIYCGKERVVDEVKGPFKLFANATTLTYTGLVMPEPLDPYGEPYTIHFTESAIVIREHPVSACEKCWGDAYMRSLGDTTKTQAEHYHDLLWERRENPCSLEEQAGIDVSRIENCRENG